MSISYFPGLADVVLPIAAAILTSKTGAKGGELAKEVLTGDLLTIEGEVFREVTIKVGRKKETRLVPIRYEARINALSLAIAAAGAGATVLFGSLALWWAQLRLKPLTQAEKGDLDLRLEAIVTTIDLNQEILDDLRLVINELRSDTLGAVTTSILQRRVTIREVWSRFPRVEDKLVALLALEDFLVGFIKEKKSELRRLKIKSAIGLQLTERLGFASGGISIFG